MFGWDFDLEREASGAAGGWSKPLSSPERASKCWPRSLRPPPAWRS